MNTFNAIYNIYHMVKICLSLSAALSFHNKGLLTKSIQFEV